MIKVESLESFSKSDEGPIALTFEEKNGALWIKLRKHTEQKLQKMRIRLEADQDTTETAKIRGRILELKNFLTLDGPEER